MCARKRDRGVGRRERQTERETNDDAEDLNESACSHKRGGDRQREIVRVRAGDRHTHRQTHRQTDTHTDTHTHRKGMRAYIHTRKHVWGGYGQ